LRYLYGISKDHRQKQLEAIIALKAEDLDNAARRLAADAATKTNAGPGSSRGLSIIIAGTRTAEKAAAELGTAVKTLPV
jgi:hypothetical protein